MDKVKINIKKVIEDDQKVDIALDFENEKLYKEYLRKQELYNVEKKDLNTEKTRNEMEKNERQRELNKLKDDFQKTHSLKIIEKGNYYDNLIFEKRDEYENQVREMDDKYNNANILLKIFYFLTFEAVRERKKLDKNYKNTDTNLRNQKQNELNWMEQKYSKELANFDKREDATILNNLILKANTKDAELTEKLKNIEYQLLKIGTNIDYIKCGDKQKYDKLFKNMNDVFELKIYPGDKLLRDIKNETSEFIEKYDLKLDLLESESATGIFQSYKQRKLYDDTLKDRFIKKELKDNEQLLSNIDGKSLDEQQRTAVITDEDNNLIIAGAGSGKTLTISAKVKYLVDHLRVNPKEILLITFTRKAADEMQERISEKLGINVVVKTFHALGYDILGYFENAKPDIYEDMEKFQKHFKNNVVPEDDKLREKVFKYFSTYINDYVDPEEFDCLGEFYRANKSNSLETIAFKLKKLESQEHNEIIDTVIEIVKKYSKKINKKQVIDVELVDKLCKDLKSSIKDFINKDNEDLKEQINYFVNEFCDELKREVRETRNKKELLQEIINQELEILYREQRTFRYEKVKSLEEIIIANFLFINGIEYEYESDYKYSTISKDFRQYKPDFYLPDYDLYIEHFGINEEGRCPQYPKLEEIKYLQGIEWKRKIHEEKGTKMEETYSFEHKQGKLISKLISIMNKYKIPLKPLSQEEIIDILKRLNKDREFNEFYKLLNTFLNLFKSSNFKKEDLESMKKKANSLENKYEQEKHSLFLDIFETYYDLYEEELKKCYKIDFNDMINKATNYITNEFLPNEFQYKYIIIDEYQDISVARYKLIKIIKDKTQAKVMAVGDDWQSIYRFTGSEISLFTKFANYFGDTETLRIEKTYRNSQELIDIAGNFIMENPSQIVKNLKSDKSEIVPVTLVEYDESVQPLIGDEHKTSLVRRLMFILTSFGKDTNKNILLLGRNNFDINFLAKSEFFRLKPQDGIVLIESNLFPNLNITFMSVHRSKGLEADEVIIINNRNDLTGFPNKMVSDSVLSYVIQDSEEYLYSEERRLFYVALTRTKNHTYLMTPLENSIFSEELKKYSGVHILNCEGMEEKISCPICSTGYLKQRKGAGDKYFYSCSNYPQCSFKTSDMAKVKSKVRCPSCGNFMVLKKGPYGEFYGCSSYPNCRSTYSVEEFERLEKNKK